MWSDLSFKERAALINQWHKEHVVDYAKKKREYDATHKFEGGGNTNSMNYEHRGTIYSDELKNQGITHVAELPEVTITGKDHNNYRSSYDPLALYKYGIAPALEGIGKAADLTLKPFDYAFDAATSPVWWLNKAITGNSDNTVQGIRDWTHQAVRDAGMLLSPTRDIGTLRTGMAPWNPENPGVFGNDETGQALNNTFDLLITPKAIAKAPKAAWSGLERIGHTEKARAAAYNNITPGGYRNSNLGGYKINHKKEVISAIKDFLTPGEIDISYPKWLEKFDNYMALHPEEKLPQYFGMSPEAMLYFRDQAWAKALKQPDNPSWHKIYKDNGNGTYRYDMPTVAALRRHFGEKDFSGFYPIKGESGSWLDGITSNGGKVNLELYEIPKDKYGRDILARMTDTWDLQPFAAPANKILDSKYGKKLPESIKATIKNIGDYELIEQFFGGDPFRLDNSWGFNKDAAIKWASEQ